jgi:alpha-tubulin suppressor-like RCC1 family protein
VNVCASVVPAGYAHCSALLRTDATAKGERPSQGGVTPFASIGDGGAYSPAYLQSAYNVASLGAAGSDGIGQTVAIVDASSNPKLVSDVAYYRHYFNLPACPVGTVSASASGCALEIVNQAGSASPLPSTSASWGLEEAIDAEMISALCPNCQILVVEASTASMSDLGASVNTAVSLGANVVSNSYGSPEFAGENSLSSADYLHPGVAVVAATGDNGYGVQFPAASPNVVAVGGTTLIQNSATGTRDGSESVWNDAGSGCSLYEPKPSWQHDTGCSRRTVADIAAEANPNTGTWVYDTFGASGLYVAGGTSVATALVSALYGVVNTGSSNTLSPDSVLYRAASGSLYQVSAGSNSACGTYLCNAADSSNGYNGPTGLGTPGGSPNSLAALSLSGATNAPTPSTEPTPTSLVSTTPGAPTNLDAVPGNKEAIVGWTPPLSIGSSAIERYVVSDNRGQSCTYTVTTPETDTCIVKHLTNGTSYHFNATALNATLGSTSSLKSNAVTPSKTVAVTQVAAGYNYGCSLLASGTVQCWGANTFGQLGNGSTTDSSAPVSVVGVTSAIQIGVNANYSCALLVSGTVQCWGQNTSGQLGNESMEPSSVPVTVKGISDATEISLGPLSACAVIAGGNVKCWGDNVDGQLGDGTTTASLIPVAVTGINNALQVKTSFNHTCALLVDGTVECWGDNVHGQLGNGESASSLVPVSVTGLSGVSELGVGFNNTCALLTSGSVVCWGFNGDGELGDGSLLNSSTPVAVTGLVDVRQLTTSAYSSCALLTSGVVECWGYQSAGELNLGTTSNAEVPLVVDKLSGVTQINRSYDYHYTCAIENSQTVVCWSNSGTSPALVKTPLKVTLSSTTAPLTKPSKKS